MIFPTSLLNFSDEKNRLVRLSGNNNANSIQRLTRQTSCPGLCSKRITTSSSSYSSHRRLGLSQLRSFCKVTESVRMGITTSTQSDSGVHSLLNCFLVGFTQQPEWWRAGGVSTLLFLFKKQDQSQGSRDQIPSPPLNSVLW